MGEIAENVLGGFLAAVVYAAAGSIWRWLTRPLYVPFEVDSWSPALRADLSEAGNDLDAGRFVIDYQRESYEANGMRPATVGRRPFTREVRSRRKEGFAVFMVPK